MKPTLDNEDQGIIPRNALHFDAGQGAGEARTEAYIGYDEGALEPATQPSAKSPSGVGSSADEQARAVHGVSEHTGFPNAATDRRLTGLDLHQRLVKHPASTFFMQISGNDWQEQGIFAGDIAIIDRALQPRPNDLAIWWVADSFVIGHTATEPIATAIFGVVIATVHQYRAMSREK